MANAHQNKMAKHLTFFQTGALLPSLRAVGPTGPEILTILTTLFLYDEQKSSLTE